MTLYCFTFRDINIRALSCLCCLLTEKKQNKNNKCISLKHKPTIILIHRSGREHQLSVYWRDAQISVSFHAGIRQQFLQSGISAHAKQA